MANNFRFQTPLPQDCYTRSTAQRMQRIQHLAQELFMHLSRTLNACNHFLTNCIDSLDDEGFSGRCLALNGIEDAIQNLALLKASLDIVNSTCNSYAQSVSITA